MKYYKLITQNGWREEEGFIKDTIYSGSYVRKPYTDSIEDYATKHYKKDWKEVTELDYCLQEGIMPEYFAIKRVADNPLWKKYIDWLNMTYNRYVDGTSIMYPYYGFGGKNIWSTDLYKSKLTDFKNNPVELTLEQWDKIINKTMEEEFKLPEYWQIRRNNENYGIINKWMNDYHNIRKGTATEYTDTEGYANNKNRFKTKDLSLPEITTEQFIKYVLKQEVMEENKEIIGWKLKEDCNQYEQAALNIVNQSKFYNFAEGYNFSTNSENESTFKKAGVLELWFEPVYKEKTLQFGGYDVIFEKVTSGVRISCNGETGTFSQIQAIYNFFKGGSASFKFGSQEVKEVKYPSASWKSDFDPEPPTSIKIGCTTGAWEEFVAIYEKAKSML